MEINVLIALEKKSNKKLQTVVDKKERIG